MWASTRTSAAALDDADELAGLRARYNLSPGVIHLDGNSGGAQPSSTPAQLRQFIEHRWERGPVRTRAREDWRTQARMAAAELAPLIGADANEVTVAESTSMNLFNALLVAARLRPDRPILAVGKDCFASDHYLARSAADFTGRELRLLTGSEDLERALAEGAAVVALAHTDTASGEVRDAAAFDAEIHRHGALALWDLSNSAGALRVDLHDWDADFAVGCGYKFLGGGSGAPAYTYIAQRHLDRLRASGDAPVGTLAERGFTGSPSEFSMSGLRAGLSILHGVSPAALERKAIALADLFLRRLGEADLPADLEIVPLREGGLRGNQVCLRHPRAPRLAHELFCRGVVVDSVDPDVLRFCFSPSWLRYGDAWEAAETLRGVLAELDV